MYTVNQTNIVGLRNGDILQSAKFGYLFIVVDNVTPREINPVGTLRVASVGRGEVQTFNYPEFLTANEQYNCLGSLNSVKKFLDK